MRTIWSGTFAIFFANTVYADHHSIQIDSCDGSSYAKVQAGFLLEPWEENSRYIQDHQVRLAVLSNSDEKQARYHLLILGQAPYWPNDTGPRQCRVITLEGEGGFSKIEMSGLDIKEIKQRGRDALVLSLPVETSTLDGSGQPRSLSVNLYPETGDISAKFDAE